VYDGIIYFIYILPYIRHNGDVSLKKKIISQCTVQTNVKFNKNLLRLLIRACTFLHVIGYLCKIKIPATPRSLGGVVKY